MVCDTAWRYQPLDVLLTCHAGGTNFNIGLGYFTKDTTNIFITGTPL